MKKMLLVLVAVMWMIIGVQYMFGKQEKEEKLSVQAFYEDMLSEMPCDLEAIGDYTGEYLDQLRQQELLKDLAEGMGITKNYEFTSTYSEPVSETVLTKKGKQTEVVLKIITTEDRVKENELQMKQQLSACISLYPVSSGISEYQALLIKLFEEYGTEAQMSIRFQGTYQGEGL